MSETLAAPAATNFIAGRWSPSQSGHTSGFRTTGIRLWSSAHSSFAWS